MRWSKDNKKLQDNPLESHMNIVNKKKRRTILIIRNVSKMDNGIYGCHATDPVSRQVISMYGRMVVQGEKYI